MAESAGAVAPLTSHETELLAEVLGRLVRGDDYVSYRASILTVDSSVRISADEVQAIDHARLLGTGRRPHRGSSRTIR